MIIYVLAIFLSAALLFLVQPMAAKLVLPLLGGSPAVWTTCMLFFQMLLLGGYLYGHLVDRYLTPSRQVLVHTLVMLAAAASLPLGLPALTEDPTGIIALLPQELGLSLWLLVVLGMAVGAPFFVVSTTGPLLQRWFSRTGHAHARDPYFLYAASNAGSLIGLGAYPLGFEPFLGVKMQGVAWSVLYGVFAALALGCGVLMVMRERRESASSAAVDGVGGERGAGLGGAGVPMRRKLRWLVLAAVPSSLMLGVTQHVSTDLAAVPLLWIVPLALYLVTFILAFSPRIRLSPRVLGLVLAVAAPLLIATMIMAWRSPLLPLVGGHFAVFFIATLMCHRLLADERPPPDQLTVFYLMMAAGGVVGGLFNSLLAPMAFNDVYEYPIALTAALALRPAARALAPAAGPVADGGSRGVLVLRRAILPAALLVVTILVTVLLDTKSWRHAVGVSLVVTAEPWLRTVLPIALAALAIRRPLQYAACFAVLGWTMYFSISTEEWRIVHQERSFFGVLRVTEQAQGKWRTLSHGTTIHGVQLLYDQQTEYLPTTYYHPAGPVGQLYEALGNDPRLRSVGLVGLGAGTMAAYAQPADHYTFYEIDRSVVDIAKSEKYFTFLRNGQGEMQVVLADGRLGMQAHARDGEYGLVVLDAFSSDAIPVHLITKEAIEGYFRKLMPGGMLLVHISNRHFNLTPVVLRIAQELGYSVMANFEIKPTSEQERQAMKLSRWMVMARTPGDMAGLASLKGSGWRAIGLKGDAPLWTDDYSDVLSVLKTN